MEPAKPSLELVRSVTDEHVLRALVRHRRLTRAELAAEIGISKPTAGESVRRLAERGLVVDTGERSPGGRGRGRVGSYYALSADVGAALAVGIAPSGVVAECVDVYGTTIARAHRELGRPAGQAQVTTALREAAAEVAAATSPRLAVVSAADPVDRATGRLVHLPDAPFLVGDLDPVAILAPYVDGPVVVDNDVNWAAEAERDHTGPDFAYLHLGEGLGAAIVHDGEIRRGSTGLAGEVAYLLTAGPSGRAMRFIDVFAELELRQPDSTAIDVERLLARRAEIARPLGEAIAGVLAALVALCDPDRVIIGGSWGPELLPDLPAMPRQPTLQAATRTADPGFTGARADAVSRLTAAITAGT
ncbi:ROK family transcriptional regulator [Amycolatopsis sp. YIM 10]|uniref:ROK family transcriptional regulator n=1 Tax=Amycolatopsis sp. YIM 10 TaxID=2653857 RepID=UPI00128FE95A|nr:ROK family transcriptional regulator [Amycolatopsis sp. YIM 10]QFU91819.1 N-acetylmannosamine kinase [Amycolatopsis sp. YIM 10]